MPELSEITYSRDVCVAAIRDYYHFLTKMYLRESTIIEPPAGGWPSITTTSMQAVGKTETVISLLRHLPYMREPDNEDYKAHGAPLGFFYNWEHSSRLLAAGHITGEHCRVASENDPLYEQVPAHVVGLTTGPPRDNPMFLLDTELGVIYWPECPGEIRYDPSAPREQVEDDAYDYAPENEAHWRADGGCWAVTDFFEILKDRFRRLHFVPVSEFVVKDIWTMLYNAGIADREGDVHMVLEIYRQHGWPDLRRYRKRECLEAVQRAMLELELEQRDDGPKKRRLLLP